MVTRSEVRPYQGPPAPARLRRSFPRLMEYLDGLPAGLHSYPECQARSTILGTFIDVGPKLPPDADPFIAGLLGPPSGGFVTEVVQNAGILAIAEAAAMSEAQYLELCRVGDQALLAGPLLQALMSLLSPLALLERAPARWQAFHPGTRLTITRDGPGRAIAQLAFPDRLYSPLHLRGLGVAFAVALELSRANDSSVELTAHQANGATFLARWRQDDDEVRSP